MPPARYQTASLAWLKMNLEAAVSDAVWPPLNNEMLKRKRKDKDERKKNSELCLFSTVNFLQGPTENQEADSEHASGKNRSHPPLALQPCAPSAPQDASLAPPRLPSQLSLFRRPPLFSSCLPHVVSQRATVSVSLQDRTKATGRGRASEKHSE